jgi:hypothetical protein
MKYLTLSLSAKRDLSITALLAFVVVGYSCSRQVQVRPITGTSDSVVTIPPPGLRVRVRGPMRLPDGLPPPFGGMNIEAGAEVELNLPPGDITIRDTIRTASAAVVADIATTGVLGGGSISGHGGGTFDQSESSYAFSLPAFFGSENIAVVPIAGEFSFEGSTDDWVSDAFELNPGDISAFTYHLSGPGPVWRAPMQTPYGLIEGTGSIEGQPFDVTFSGDLAGLSGTATRTGEREYQLTTRIPVVFSTPEVSGAGVETETFTVGWDEVD